MTVLTGQIIPRQDTAANWTSENPILAGFEIGFETDTRLSKRGDGINHWNDLPYETTSSSESHLTSGGGITIVTDDITVAEAIYYISGFGTYTAPQITFNNIALSSSGTQRFVAFYGKTDSTIVKVEGVEGAVASMPSGPANSVLINYSLVSDAAIGSGVDLSGYLLKSDKATGAEVITGTNDTKYVTPLAMKGAKDASGGYAGLTLFKINFKNALNTFTSFFTNSNTAARTYTFQDRNGTIADHLDKKYSLQYANVTQGSPADATTYYFGGQWSLGLSSGTNDGRDIVVPSSGTITAMTIFIYTNSAIGTTENSTWSIVVLNPSDGSVVSTNLVSNTIKWSNASKRNVYLITGLNISVTEGQLLLVKLETPTWATNPTVTWQHGSIFIS